MMMGNEKVRHLPALRLRGGDHRIRVGDVDRRRRAGSGIVNEDAEIVFEADELMNVSRHDRLLIRR
jgi:hypothetical protein